MLLLLEPYLHSKLKCVFHLFMLRIMVKVNAYILSVHSSSGFYEELHQVVVTLPSRQVKRLKLGDWRFVRDYFQVQEVLTWSSDGPFPALSCSWARHCLNKYFEIYGNSKYLECITFSNVSEF